MTQYSVSEAGQHLTELLDEVEAGEPVRLTRAGKTVAVIVSPEEYERLQKGDEAPTQPRLSFLEAYEEFRKQFPEGHGIEPEYWEGIRSKDPGHEINL